MPAQILARQPNHEILRLLWTNFPTSVNQKNVVTSLEDASIDNIKRSVSGDAATGKAG
jgi:hypothetical protein